MLLNGRREGLHLWLLLLAPFLLGAARHHLVREDLNLVNPLQYGTDLNDATLSAALSAIGSSQASLMLTPGTWSIDKGLTIPETVHVIVAPGARLNVTAGHTLWIKDPRADLPMQHVFGGPGAVRLASPSAPQFWGAVVDDGGDDTAAIQSALDVITPGYAEQNAGGIVHFPPGTYQVSATLTLREKAGFIIQGSGKYATHLAPTAALQGQSVVRLVNCDSGAIRDMRILGNSSAPPLAAIESRVEDPNSVNPSRMQFRDLVLGSDGSDSLVNGMLFSAAPGADHNNDVHTIDNVNVYNCSQAGVFISHAESLGQRLIGGTIMGCPVGVKTNGGSIVVNGTFLSVSGWDFEIDGALQNHPQLISNVFSEGNSGVLRSAADGARILITNYDKKGGTGSGVGIEMTGNDAFLSISNSRMGFGSQIASARFTATNSKAALTANELGFSDFLWNGHLVLVGNYHFGGNVIETPGASASLYQAGDFGAQYSTGMARMVDGRPSPRAGVSTQMQPTGSHSGSLTIAGDNPATTHGFWQSEPDTNYQVFLAPASATAGAQAGSTRVVRVDKRTNNFTAYVESAPGTNQSVTFDFFITRGSF